MTATPNPTAEQTIVEALRSVTQKLHEPLYTQVLNEQAAHVAMELRAHGLLSEGAPSEGQIEAEARGLYPHDPDTPWDDWRADAYRRAFAEGVRWAAGVAPQEPSGDEFASGECRGDVECPAEAHIHGCFADTGNCDKPTDHEASSPDREKLIAEAHEFIPAWSDGQIKSLFDRLADALAAQPVTLDPEKVAKWLSERMPRKSRDETYGQYDRRCARALCEAAKRGEVS